MVQISDLSCFLEMHGTRDATSPPTVSALSDPTILLSNGSGSSMEVLPVVGMQTEHVSSEDKDLGPTQILICESQWHAATDLQYGLTCPGYETHVVSDFDTAMKFADDIKPTLLLTEVSLRGATDGIQLAAKIKERHGTTVIFLAELCDEKTVQRAKIVRPAGYLIKPFSLEQLRVTVDVALSNCEQDLRSNTDGAQSFALDEIDLIIPICSHCKQIRDKAGSWHYIDAYLTERFGLRFTHSLCPECVRVFSP